MLSWVAAHTPAFCTGALVACAVLFSNSSLTMVIGMAAVGTLAVLLQVVLSKAAGRPALQALVGGLLLVDLAAASLALPRARWWTLFGLAPAALACLSGVATEPHWRVGFSKAAFVGTLAYCCLAAMLHYSDAKPSWVSFAFPVPLGLLAGALLDNRDFAVAAQVLLPEAIYKEVKARGVHSGIAVVVVLACKETAAFLEVAQGVLTQG